VVGATAIERRQITTHERRSHHYDRRLEILGRVHPAWPDVPACGGGCLGDHHRCCGHLAEDSG
jgi:hypothetical protein